MTKTTNPQQRFFRESTHHIPGKNCPGGTVLCVAPFAGTEAQTHVDVLEKTIKQLRTSSKVQTDYNETLSS